MGRLARVTDRDRPARLGPAWIFQHRPELADVVCQFGLDEQTQPARRTVANDKITMLNMTYGFILRAAMTFTAQLALEAAWARATPIATWLSCQVYAPSCDYPLVEPSGRRRDPWRAVRQLTASVPRGALNPSTDIVVAVIANPVIGAILLRELDATRAPMFQGITPR